MPDRRPALKDISRALRRQAEALQGLTQPGDSDLPIGMRLLLDAIDRIDVVSGQAST